MRWKRVGPHVSLPSTNAIDECYFLGMALLLSHDHKLIQGTATLVHNLVKL
jgi:hypothetical protein